jgi:hypothetical protein
MKKRASKKQVDIIEFKALEDVRPLLTIDVGDWMGEYVPPDAIVRIRPSADTTDTALERTISEVRAQIKTGAVRVLAKPKGSAVLPGQAVIEQDTRSLREICLDVAKTSPETMREAVVSVVERVLSEVGL